MSKIGLDEVEDLGDEWAAHCIGNFRTPNTFWREQTYETRCAWAIGRSEVRSRDHGQCLGWRPLKKRCRIEHHLQDREALAQDGLEVRLLRWKIPVDERLRLELGPLGDALDRGAAKPMLREFGEGRVQNLLAPIRAADFLGRVRVSTGA
jgi:hypothetical protein